MNPQLRHRLLAEAAVESHAHPADVGRAVSFGMHAYRHRLRTVYLVTSVVWSVVLITAFLLHPAFRALGDAGGALPATTASSTPSAPTPTSTPGSAAVLSSISIVPGMVRLAPGTTAELRVVGNFGDGSTGAVTGVPSWTSSDDSVVTVSSDGIVTAIGVGATATITATIDDFSDTAPVIVDPQALVSLSIRSVESSSTTFQKDLEDDGQATLTRGLDATLVADGAYNDESSRPVNDAAWASDDQSVATIDAAGYVQAVAPGTARISATSAGAEGTLVVATITIEVTDVIVD
ncbi:Ig-like domain-containing protein [Cryobacterium sp. CG_9.6]|uniref:Ig-like domain-containing protein n=1 Tax=Cryobacterium sp. CG_9.6 TaxID=2760710 RepID=UPI00247390B9|nr:Ig-like domain-containing protein [Cryobacterium sp. CG_9.6]MDH6236113.1 hypothetical protein [Cryobacterium sp. CG_9.6]